MTLFPAGRKERHHGPEGSERVRSGRMDGLQHAMPLTRRVPRVASTLPVKLTAVLREGRLPVVASSDWMMVGLGSCSMLVAMKLELGWEA